MTIELCVDIANHIIADRGLRGPGHLFRGV